ncbi:hypothetical protein Tco_1324159 [Tanacetum coccineum]
MVAYLEKSEGSEEFHQIIDFLSECHIKYALTESPTIYASLIEQFLKTAALTTTEDGVMAITATIDKKVKVLITEASIRRHVKLKDSKGLNTLFNEEIFEQLAHMGNMKRASKGYYGVITPLFETMLVQHQDEEPSTHESSPSRITSSPSLSPQHTPITSGAEEHAPMPHESTLQSVHLLGRDEGSLSLTELTTYNAALTKLIKRVKKLEQTIKTSKSRSRTKVVISDDEEDEEDPSKQGKSLIEELDMDVGISLVHPHATDRGKSNDTQVSGQPEEQLGVFSATKILADAAEQGGSAKNVQTYTRKRKEVSTGSGGVSTASRLVSNGDVSTASGLDSTAGKTVIQESELPKKIKRRVQVQMSVDQELAHKLLEEERARFNAEQEAKLLAEQEQETIDFETALKLQKQLDERQKVIAKDDQAHDIDWSDPAVIRFHAQQNRSFSVAEDSEIKKEVMKRPGFDLQQESSKQVEEKIVQQEDVVAEQVVKESTEKAGGRRKKSLARKKGRETISEEKGESLDVESLATKYLIVDWETQMLATDKYYYQIKRANGSVKYYNLFSAMLYDFDRQDVLELYRLVKERFQTASPEGYDLLLRGDLKTMMEQNREDEIWRNQQDWNLLS